MRVSTERAPTTMDQAALAQLPPLLHEKIIHAYSQSLDTVFLSGVPVLIAAFILSWFLPEVSLREMAGLLHAVDESFGLQDVGVAEICEELAVRRQAADAALRRLDELDGDASVSSAQRDWLRHQYQHRIDRLDEFESIIQTEQDEGAPEFRQLALEPLQTERSELERLAAQDSISPVVAERAIRDVG